MRVEKNKRKLENVVLTFVPSFSKTESDINLTAIHQSDVNTFTLYKRSRSIGKFINLKPSNENFNLVMQQLDKSFNKYFDLPKPNVVVCNFKIRVC
jgi:protocatechuate 3,4-dioxygenase beta subunit